MIDNYIDTPIILRQEVKYHKALELLTRLMQYSSIEEYVNHMVEQSIRMELDGAGKLNPTDDDIKEIRDSLTELFRSSSDKGNGNYDNHIPYLLQQQQQQND